MSDMAAISEDMEVLGSDGERVGTVDKVEGELLKLNRKDPAAGGQHHYLPVSLIASVDQSVRLSVSGEQARQQWSSDPVGARMKQMGGSDDMYARNRESSGGELF